MTTTEAPGEHVEFALQRNLIGRVNVGDMITRSAARAPRDVAVSTGDRALTYAELDREVNRLAQALVGRGYERGDALALASGNSLEFLVTYYACAKLGVVCVPINLAWSAAETTYVLDHSRARGVVVERQLAAWLAPALEDVPAVGDVIVAPGTGEGEPPQTWTALDAFLADASDTEPAAYVEDRDALSYLYTSGTTAAPKGVVGSHLAIYLESTSAVMDMRFGPEDRVEALMPLFHTAQLNGFATPVALVGGRLDVMRAFDPAALLERIESERLTVIFALPMMYRAMLDHPDVARRDLSSLRLAVYAMAPMPDADLRRAIDTFGCDFGLLFGQTEMAPITTFFRPEHQLTHTGAVGTPTRNVQVAIMDDAGGLLDQGETGEIVYRGPHALEGYLRDEEATAAVFAHGWFHSGDMGHFDADGILWFEDRTKDVIKSGGENVASIEVEKALFADPGIAEVAVIGLPHPRWTEAITAVAVPAPGAELDAARVLGELREGLAPFKVPKDLIVLDALPRTSTGKVQKNVLRQRYADNYQEG